MRPSNFTIIVPECTTSILMVAKKYTSISLFNFELDQVPGNRYI